MLFCLAAALSWATGSFYSAACRPDDAIESTAWQMLIGGVAMMLVGVVAGEANDVHPDRFSFDSVIALVYLITIGGLLAYTAYTWLLKNAPISTVATYAYVNPVIAIVLGWAILSEEITVTVVAGAAAIVLSVAAVVRTENEAPAATPARRRRRWSLREAP